MTGDTAGRRASVVRECALVGLLYAIVLLVFAYPLTRHPMSTVAALTVPADTDLFVWTLGWDLHQLAQHPLSVFDANIYYPFDRTLAYPRI